MPSAPNVAVEGDFFPGETDEVTSARALARECAELVEILNDYRRRLWARLARERSESLIPARSLETARP